MIYEQIAMERLRPIDKNQPGHAQRHHDPSGPACAALPSAAPIKPVLRKIAQWLVPLPKPFDYGRACCA